MDLNPNLGPDELFLFWGAVVVIVSAAIVVLHDLVVAHFEKKNGVKITSKESLDHIRSHGHQD